MLRKQKVFSRIAAVRLLWLELTGIEVSSALQRTT
jgi:hypothetical protein